MKQTLSNQELALILVTLLAAALPLEADECWMGERFGIKALDYSGRSDGVMTREQCRMDCEADVGNALQICHRLGAPYINNGEFGCFFKDASHAAELLAAPTDKFFGCTEVCECPEGTWYETFRRRCVEPTGSRVPNMPNGDKGGGYYVKDGYLFKDAEQAECLMLPASEPKHSRSGGRISGRWTPWMNIDRPGGHGDIEQLDAYIMNGAVCPQPIDIQCRTIAGVNWLETGQVYTCQKSTGGTCTNFTQVDGRKCLDYEVRFLFPYQSGPDTPDPINPNLVYFSLFFNALIKQPPVGGLFGHACCLPMSILVNS